MISTFKNGVFWCKDAASWQRFKEITDDPETLNISYEAWVKLSQQRFDIWAKEGAANGKLFVKVNADPDAFVEWCRVNSHRPNKRARMLYAAQKADEIIGSG